MKKKKEKLPRFRSDGKANLPIQDLIQIQQNKITRTYLRSKHLSDHGDDYTSDSSEVLAQEGGRRELTSSLAPAIVLTVNSVWCRDEEFYHDRKFKDVRNFQGNGEFHGGNAQNFHDNDRNVYDGDEKVGDYEKVYNDERVYDGDQKFYRDSRPYDHKNFNDGGQHDEDDFSQQSDSRFSHHSNNDGRHYSDDFISDQESYNGFLDFVDELF